MCIIGYRFGELRMFCLIPETLNKFLARPTSFMSKVRLTNASVVTCGAGLVWAASRVAISQVCATVSPPAAL